MATNGIDVQPLKDGNAGALDINAGASFASTDSNSGGKKKTTGPEELVRSMISDSADDNIKQFLCIKCPGNVLVLMLTTFLFALITSVQYVAAAVAHSLALRSDCNAMAADTLSYFLNIFAELAPAKIKRKLQLVVPMLSLSVLAVLTYMSLMDALDTIYCSNHPDSTEDKCQGPPDETSPWVVWVFGFVGMIFDIISIFAFYRNKKRAEGEDGGLPVNMLAAFMHVGADFVRSITTTVEGFFLIANFPPDMDGDAVDAYSCCVITGVIAIALLYGYYEVVRDIITYCRTGE